MGSGMRVADRGDRHGDHHRRPAHRDGAERAEREFVQAVRACSACAVRDLHERDGVLGNPCGAGAIWRSGAKRRERARSSEA